MQQPRRGSAARAPRRARASGAIVTFTVTVKLRWASPGKNGLNALGDGEGGGGGLRLVSEETLLQETASFQPSECMSTVATHGVGLLPRRLAHTARLFEGQNTDARTADGDRLLANPG